MKLRSQWTRSDRMTIMALSGAAVLFCSIMLLVSGSFIQQQEAGRRSEALAIYWNRYAANYYEMHGGWEGLGERLQADVLDYPDKAVRVRVYDVRGEPVASVGAATDQLSRSLTGKPLVENGVIVGYTETSGESGAVIPPAAWIGAVAAFMIGIGLWLLLYARWRSVTNRVLSRLYVRVTGIVPDRASVDRSVKVKAECTHDSIAEDVLLEDRMERELAQLEGYVRKLETVRRSMVADIAHELRTPLAIMRSQLENALIAETPLTLEKSAAMHDELLYLTKLVHDLQELALAEAGKLPLEKRWFSLCEVSRAVIEALQGDAEEQSLSVNLHASGDVRVYADPLRIRQLIVNLIGNALQHARTQVTVTVLQQDGNAIWTVMDDGLGIEEEQIAHLFERFYRNDSEPRESNRRGLGLGLSIVKQYTEAHGGIIEVESRWGEGTIFRIQLPVIAA